MAAARSFPRKAWQLFPALIAGVAFLGMQSDLSSMPARRLADYPRLMLWAWERPEDLTFIPPDRVGVAFLAETIWLRGDGVGVIVQPRLQPLRMPPNTTLVAVVRLEIDRTAAPALTADQRGQVVDEIKRTAGVIQPRGIQIDFDATVSQREFYRELLPELRRELPPEMALSMTALPS